MWIIITKKERSLVRTSGSLPLPLFFGPTAIRVNHKKQSNKVYYRRSYYQSLETKPKAKRSGDDCWRRTFLAFLETFLTMVYG